MVSSEVLGVVAVGVGTARAGIAMAARVNFVESFISSDVGDVSIDIAGIDENEKPESELDEEYVEHRKELNTSQKIENKTANQT